MLNFFKEYIRNKALKERVSQGIPVFLNLKEVKSVGFVFSFTSPEDFEELSQIIAFLKKANLLWQGVVLEGKKGLLKKMRAAAGGEVMVEGVTFVGKEQMNWAGIPLASALEPFFQSKFDLFISLNPLGDFTLDYIAGGANAKMMMGMKNTRYHTYPFVLEAGAGTPTFADYFQQLFHYLSIIKQSTNL